MNNTAKNALTSIGSFFNSMLVVEKINVFWKLPVIIWMASCIVVVLVNSSSFNGIKVAANQWADTNSWIYPIGAITTAMVITINVIMWFGTNFPCKPMDLRDGGRIKRIVDKYDIYGGIEKVKKLTILSIILFVLLMGLVAFFNSSQAAGSSGVAWLIGLQYTLGAIAMILSIVFLLQTVSLEDELQKEMVKSITR